MVELLVVLIPIAIVDLMNPILLAALIYLLGSRHPYWYSLVMLFSFFFVYLISGIFIAIGLEHIIEYVKNPTPIDYAIQFTIGILLLWLTYYLFQPSHRHPEDKFHEPSRINTRKAFWIGFQVNLIGIAFAIPYLAAIDQMLKEQLSDFLFVMFLLYYNILYILPFVFLVFLRLLLRESVDPFLASCNDWMEKIGAWVTPILVGLLGAVLVADTIAYVFGRPFIIS